MTDAPACTHLQAVIVSTANSSGCEDCLRSGGRWLHLRRCTSCGHVGCCDSSPNRHATGHHHSSDHPLIQSFEPGEDWIWCYEDQILFEIPSLGNSQSHP